MKVVPSGALRLGLRAGALPTCDSVARVLEIMKDGMMGDTRARKAVKLAGRDYISACAMASVPCDVDPARHLQARIDAAAPALRTPLQAQLGHILACYHGGPALGGQKGWRSQIQFAATGVRVHQCPMRDAVQNTLPVSTTTNEWFKAVAHPPAPAPAPAPAPGPAAGHTPIPYTPHRQPGVNGRGGRGPGPQRAEMPRGTCWTCGVGRYEHGACSNTACIKFTQPAAPINRGWQAPNLPGRNPLTHAAPGGAPHGPFRPWGT